MTAVTLTINLDDKYFVRALESCCVGKIDRTALKKKLKDPEFLKELTDDILGCWENTNSEDEGEGLIMLFEECLIEE